MRGANPRRSHKEEDFMDYEIGLAVCQTILDLLEVSVILALPYFWQDLRGLIRG